MVSGPKPPFEILIHSLLTIKKKANRVRLFRKLAEWTGLEPATSAVTGQHSNQLNYHSKFNKA